MKTNMHPPLPEHKRRARHRVLDADTSELVRLLLDLDPAPEDGWHMVPTTLDELVAMTGHERARVAELLRGLVLYSMGQRAQRGWSPLRYLGAANDDEEVLCLCVHQDIRRHA